MNLLMATRHQSLAYAALWERSLVLASNFRGNGFAILQVLIYFRTMPKVVPDDRINVDQLKGWIPPQYFVGIRPVIECIDNCVQCHSRIADPHNTVLISSQWNGFRLDG